MRKFLFSPFFRCLICLILISCILVNCSPIRADAFATGAAVTAIVGSAAAVTVVAGVMMALGVMPDSANTAAFETVVNGCTSALTASGVFLNGLVTVLQLSDHDLTNNYVNQGIVEAVLDWLFSSNTIGVEKVDAPEGSYYCNDIFIADFPVDLSRQIVLFTRDNYLTIAYVGEDKSGWFYDPSNSTIDSPTNGYYTQYKHGEWTKHWTFTSSFSASDLIWANIDIVYTTDSSQIYYKGSEPTSSFTETSIATGLIAGLIGTDIETDYETWVQDGVVAVDFGIGYVDDPNTENDDDDDDEGDTEIGPSNPKDPVTPENPAQPSTAPSPWWKDNKWLNIGGGIIGAGLGELTYQLLNQTQNGIQTGSGDPAQKVDTSLFANNGNGTNNWLDPNPSVPEPTIPVVPPVSSDIAGYTFDLKDIFPFCIPFDIYNFLKCLDAPPEAPVINWELYEPGGGAYPLIIDLSVFDEVAQLLRRLELLLFCVGLAFKTRDLIKG